MWDERLFPVLAGIVIGGAIGSRTSSLLDQVDAHGLSAIGTVWLYGGRTILGGLSGAYIGGVIGKRIGGYPYRTGAMFAPAVAIGLAIGRIGCFLSEAPGRPTGLPWGIRVDPVTTANIPDCPGCVQGLPMHPSMLYEIAFLLLAFVLIKRYGSRITAPGEVFVLFLTCYAVFRFFVEFTRANPVNSLGLTGSQVFLLVVSPLLIWRVVQGARRGVYRDLFGSSNPREDIHELATT
jgi:prolipoprotein diacylglyceryltransferase